MAHSLQKIPPPILWHHQCRKEASYRVKLEHNQKSHFQVATQKTFATRRLWSS